MPGSLGGNRSCWIYHEPNRISDPTSSFLILGFRSPNRKSPDLSRLPGGSEMKITTSVPFGKCKMSTLSQLDTTLAVLSSQ